MKNQYNVYKKIIAHVERQPQNLQHFVAVYENVRRFMDMKTDLTKDQKKEIILFIKNKISKLRAQN